MSSSKPLKSKKRDKENAKKSFADSPTVESDSNHEDLTGCDVLKSSLKRRESPKDVHKVSRKPFVIPRKNKQVKELFQSQHFDSREVRELLRHVNQSFRYQLSSSMFKFEKVEFVNNEKLRQKYAEKKQEMRIVLPKNRELEEKFGFLYTPSRSKVKEICEKGLQTGHCNLNFLGDPKLGVYVCRYADIVNKRQLDDEDKGYLIVFNVVKGRIKGISGGNPEQQPTPHHDCHVSKLFMNLTSSATHSEIYGASMFYFYEIDENSEDFHAKQPRQVLPYAVLTFSIIKPEVPQPRSGIEEAKNKDNVSRMSDNPVLSPLSEDVNDTLISASTVSWTGQLFYKNKFIGFINLVTYSMKKLFLPSYVDQKINICSKISLDHLKSVFKCPIFKNGKPSATGVSKEFSSGGMFTYYEVQPIYQERERFNKIMAYFKAENVGAVMEYIAGVAYMYILPTSQLTHDAGITDEKSTTSLHVLVHLKRICPFPGSQDNPQPTEMSGSSSSEESISSRVQEILKEKLNIKPKKKAQPPSLFTKKFVVNPKKSVDEPRFISVSDSLKEKESRKTSDGKRKESTKSENSKVKVHRSESWAGNDHLGHESSTSNAYNNSSSISRYKWFNQNESNDLSSLGNESDKSCLNREIKTKRQEANDARSESCKPESGQRQQGDSSKDSHSKGQNRGNLKRSSSLDTDASIDLASIQKLIESYKKDSSLSVVFSKKVSLPSVDPRPSEEQMASTDAGMIKEVKDIPDSCKHPSIPAPPLPPPLPLTSPPLPPLPPSNTPPLPPLPATISPFLIQSPVPSTPDASTKQSSSLSEALESLLSAWPSKNNTSGVSTSKSGKPQESSSSSGTWPSPPSVERKSMLIPGLEPPGSPVFNLIKDKQVLSIAKGRHGNIDHVKGHSTSPLAVDTKAIAPSPIINPQSIPLVKKISQNESSENVTSHCTIQEIPRTVTVAEQAASVEAKEKVMAILKQSAQAQADANTLPENVSFPDSGHREVKSILKSTKYQSEAKQEKVIDQSKTDLTVFNDVSSTPIAQFQESSVKVVSLNEYRQKQKEQNTSSLASNTAKTLNTTCTSSPELRSGLDLIDKLLSAEKGQASPDANTESSEDTIVSSCKKTIANRDKDANGSRNSENGAPRKRRRIVTVKRKSQERTCGYDDMTSDISDEELPDDKITSDISDTELPEDYTEPDDARAEQKDPPRSMSRTDTLPKHKLLLRDEHGKRLNDMRSLSDREKSPQKKARSPLRSPSRMTFRDSNRHDSKSTSPDDWGREKKRRRIEMQQKDYRTGMHDRMEDNDSGSNMSISPITSPVSFEYANDGTYQSINSPLRGATLPLDSRGLGGMAMPRSPPEIGRIDSPGTPETALPATDFLHADIGYWSTGLTVADNAALPYGTLGYLETHVDSDLYESVKQTSVHPDIPRYEIRSNDMEYYEVANERHIQPPYYSNPRPISELYQGQQNTASENHPTEEPRVDSRGEGYLVSGSSDIGDGSGYESPSYMELRRPFFGTTDDLILSAYDKNVTCTDYVDVYTCPSTRVDKLRDNDQDCYFMPRSPYEDVKSPCSPVTSDVELDRFEGRGPSSTPEYEGKQYQSDRRIVTVGEYPEYANRPESDDEERVQQCVDEYDPEEASYLDEGDYFSDNKLREPRYRDYDEEYETFDQRYCGLGQNTHLSNQYTYSSDDEDPLGVARLPSRHAYHSEDSKLRENFFSENEDFMRNARQSDRENYNSGDKTDYDRSMSPSSRDYHNSGAKDNMRSTRRSYRDYYSERNEDYVRDSRPSSRKAHNLEDENRMRDSRSSSRQAHNFDDKDYGRDSRPSSRQSHNLDDEGRMRDSRPSSRQAHNSDDEDRIRDSRPSSRQTHNFNDKDYARESRSSSRQEHNSKDGDDARDASQSSRPNYKSEDEYRARDTRRSNPDKYNSGNADCSRPSNRQKYDQGSKSDACSSSRRGTRYKNDFTSEDENITSGDYNERDYQYLDDIVKEDKEKTTLQLDNIVCEGLSRFPPNFRNLLQMQSHDNDSNADLVGRFQLSSEMQSLRDEDDEMTSDSPNKDSVNITSMISKNRDPRLNRRLRDTENNTDNAIHQTSGGLEEKDTNFDKVEPAYAQQASRVQSYFYVYEPENDSECKAVKTYMLKTGSQYFDVRDFNADKLKAVKGGIRVLIRGKHKSALHKINNLSKLKCLKNVKFALFNTVEDVAKKTRAYTAIFQYGGVLIPDDFILRRTHPAYLEALLRFMAEENAVHQKVFWVMNVRYQAYKKLGSQRPLSWRDTFILELLRKYRNEGFVNIIQKDYVTEGLSLIQRYLDTAWRQQRDLMTTYRHFIMLSNMEKQKSEASWFRNRGIGFMDIKTFLLGFAGDKKTKQLLFSSRYTVGGNVSTPNKNITGRERNIYDRTEIDSDQKSKGSFPQRPPLSHMVSRSLVFNTGQDMKERRLQILSSIKDKKDNLINDIGGSPNVESTSESMPSHKEVVKHNDTTSSTAPSKLASSTKISAKDPVSTEESSHTDSKSSKDLNCKDSVSSKVKGDKDIQSASKDVGKSKDLARDRTPNKDVGSSRNVTRNRGRSPPKGLSRLGSPKEVSRSRKCSPKGIPRSREEISHKREVIPRNRARSPTKTTRTSFGSPKGKARKEVGSTNEFTRKNIASSLEDSGSNKDITRKETKPPARDSNETNSKDEESRPRDVVRNDPRKLKSFVSRSNENKNSKEQIPRAQKPATWSRTVRSVVLKNRGGHNASFQRGRGFKRGSYNPRGSFGRGQKRRFVQERTANHPSNA